MDIISAMNGFKKMTIYDLIHSDGNDRNYFGKMEANDIEQAQKLFKEFWFKPEYLVEVQTEYADKENVFLIWMDPIDDELNDEFKTTTGVKSKPFF